MALSQRVLSGSIVKGSVAILCSTEYSQDDVDGFIQGYNVRDFSVLTNALTYKIRSNAGTIRTLSGVDLDVNVFNDAFSPINLTAYDAAGDPTGSVRIPAPAIKGRMSERINHYMEQRDLGQSHLYEDGNAFFEAINTSNGLEVIGAKDPLELPASLVDHSSISALDGKIDPMGIQSTIDRSTIDHPYDARGIKASVGIDNDAFHRNYQLAGGLFIYDNENATVPYMDAPEVFGGVMSGSEYVAIDLPGAFYQGTSKIKPFSDVSGDVENYLNFGPGKILTEDLDDAKYGTSIIQHLSTHKFYVDNTLQNFDKLTNGGFDFTTDLGTDSLVHGGLLKG